MVLTNGKVCNRPLCLFFDLPYIRVQVRVRQLLCLTYKQLDDDAPRHGENRGSLRACQRPSCKVGSYPETKLPMVPWSWPPGDASARRPGETARTLEADRASGRVHRAWRTDGRGATGLCSPSRLLTLCPSAHLRKCEL